MDVAFPFGFDDRGATASAVDHIREMIEQVLFTAPGERVNRPDFGSGVLRLVFEPMGDAISASIATMADANLRQALADRVDFDPVGVEFDEGILRITVSYRVRSTHERGLATFERSVPLP